jgi:hypothetical protein
VHFHHETSLRADHGFVIAQMRPIGRTDFAQPAARARHDIGHAKRPADFDQLTSGCGYLFAKRESVQKQQDRSRVIVHHGRSFRARQAAKQLLHVVITLPAAAFRQVVFKIAGRARCCRHGFNRRLG